MKFLTTASLLLLALSTRAAFAGEIKPYNQAEVDKLAAQGKPILLDVRADWCPTCAAQAPVIRDLMAQDKYKDLTTFTIDFDRDLPASRYNDGIVMTIRFSSVFLMSL